MLQQYIFVEVFGDSWPLKMKLEKAINSDYLRDLSISVKINVVLNPYLCNLYVYKLSVFIRQIKIVLNCYLACSACLQNGLYVCLQ